jgi:hypothetical protein
MILVRPWWRENGMRMETDKNDKCWLLGYCMIDNIKIVNSL